MDRSRRFYLIWLLRFGGCVMMSAALAVFIPTSWMQTIHEILGMGSFPEAPLTEYLTRSIAGLYAVHGGLLFVLSHHVETSRPIIQYLGYSNIAFGVLMIGIDMVAPVPWFWLVVEGPPIIGMGCLLIWLNRQ